MSDDDMPPDPAPFLTMGYVTMTGDDGEIKIDHQLCVIAAVPIEEDDE